MAVLVEALAQAVGVLGHQRAAMARTAEDATERLGVILHEGRGFAEAEADRFRAECRAAEADTVRSLSAVLADTAERALTHRARALDRRTAALVALGMAAAFIAGGGGGWWVCDLAQILSEDHGVSVSEQTLSRVLRAMGYRKLSARQRHHAQDPDAAAVFKKTSPTVWRTSRRLSAASR